MGKVLTTFKNTYPGAISRSVDDIVISVANADENVIPFGAPVFNDADNNGGVGFSSGADMDTFLGFATRIGVKTPDTYGSSEAGYNPYEVMSVIVRGSVCVPVSDGTPKLGDAVYMDSDGKITAVATGNTELTNCKFRGAIGGNGCAEIVITTRNIQ